MHRKPGPQRGVVLRRDCIKDLSVGGADALKVDGVIRGRVSALAGARRREISDSHVAGRLNVTLMES